MRGQSITSVERRKLVKEMRERQGLTFEAIGELLDVSRQRAEQLYRPERSRARGSVWAAIGSGRIEKPSRCQRCNVEALVYGHHMDYAQRLNVQWLCGNCHRDYHMGTPDARKRREEDREIERQRRVRAGVVAFFESKGLPVPEEFRTSSV